MGNLLAVALDEVAATAKRLLKRIQYRPELIDGFRASECETTHPDHRRPAGGSDGQVTALDLALVRERSRVEQHQLGHRLEPVPLVRRDRPAA